LTNASQHAVFVLPKMLILLKTWDRTLIQAEKKFNILKLAPIVALLVWYVSGGLISSTIRYMKVNGGRKTALTGTVIDTL
jgi:hypothetical protein